MCSTREGLDDEHRGAAVSAEENRPVGSVIGIAVAGSAAAWWRLLQELANGGGSRACGWRWRGSRSVGSDESLRAARAAGSGA